MNILLVVIQRATKATMWTEKCSASPQGAPVPTLNNPCVPTMQLCLAPLLPLEVHAGCYAHARALNHARPGREHTSDLC